MGRKLLSILLALSMMLSLLLPAGAAASTAVFTDMPTADHWAYEALTAAVDNGLLQGDDTGKLRPEANLTRAQLAVIVNRLFGAVDLADIGGYTDVKPAAWYFTDIAKAVRMGTFQGDSGSMRPDAAVTRQEAFTVLARAIKLEGQDTAALDVFTDHSKVDSWAAPAISAMVKAGYLTGIDGKLEPLTSITREQFASVMDKMFSRYISASGTYTENITGNVLIRAKDVVLKGITITGDLIVGEGVASGDVTLDGVTVTGRLVVRGGGENSIRIVNQSGVGSIIVGKTGDGGVRIRTEEGCRVDVVYVDDGLDDVILEGSFNQVSVTTDAPVVLNNATVTGLTVKAENADVKLAGNTSVSVTQIAEEAAGAKLEVASGAKVARVESEADSVKISGAGQVTQAVINGSNTAVDTSGTKVTAGEGTTGVTQNGTAVTPTTPSTTTPTGGGDTSYSADVSTFAQLQAALSNSSVTDIVIKDVVDEDGLEITTNITINKPVVIRDHVSINAGITVTLNSALTIADTPADAPADAPADTPGPLLEIFGTLINNSTFTNRGLGGENSDTGLTLLGSFVNNGTFVNGSRFALVGSEFENNGTLTNESWFHCFDAELTNNGDFECSGDLTLLDGSSFENNDTLSITNSGSLLIGLGSSYTNAEGGSTPCDGPVENYGSLANSGTFRYMSDLLNAGSISGTLTQDGAGSLIEYLPAASLSELETKLAGSLVGYEGIAIVSDISLTNTEEDKALSLSKHVLISSVGSLTVPAGCTLTVTSSDGMNELKVAGTLHIDGGTLVTTSENEGEDAIFGQVTLIGGTLKASGGYTITNNGVILLINGTIDPKEITVAGNDIHVWLNIATVSDENELRKAMEDPEADEIVINADLELASDLSVTKRVTVAYDSETSTASTLTVPASVTVTVENHDGQTSTLPELSILGNVVNNGAIESKASGAGIYIGNTGTLVNNHILNSKGRFDIEKGTFTNSSTGTVGILMDAGYCGTLLVMGGSVINAGEFQNFGSVHFWKHEGQVPSLSNSGTFVNGIEDEDSSSSAYLGVEEGTLTNTGSFTNNGNMDLRYSALAHNGGTFVTYNTAGFSLTGGSFSTGAGAANNSFDNEGYMRIVDEYGKDGADNICDFSGVVPEVFKNGSNWLDYSAQVYSLAGLAAAEAAQTIKTGESYSGPAYSRLDFMTSIEFTGNKTLSAFEQYWVVGQWGWDEEESVDKLTPATLTVDNGATLTVGQRCTLHVSGGSIAVASGGALTLAAGGEGTYSGSVDVWPGCSIVNNGTITRNGGEFLLRYEYNRNGQIATDPAPAYISGDSVSVEGVEYVAIVHTAADLLNAVAPAEDPEHPEHPVFGRIELKENALVELEADANTLIINAKLYIEPGSKLIIDYGKSVTLTGQWVDNSGDVTVWGNLTIGNGTTSTSFRNWFCMAIGALSGEEAALVTVSSGSVLDNGSGDNSGTITLHATGTLDASAGQYQGTDPVEDEDGGTYWAPGSTPSPDPEP